MNAGGVPILSRVTLGNLFSIASTIVGAALTVGAVWALLGYRVTQLEGEVAAIPATYARQADVADMKVMAVDLRNAITANTKQASDLTAALTGMAATVAALKDTVVDLKNRIDRQEDKPK